MDMSDATRLLPTTDATTTKESSSTKDQLLESAVGLFAEKGFRDATCSEISRRAKANIAAINYHFGSKENLYRLSLRRAFEIANAKYPFQANLPEDAPSEDQLFANMNAIIRRNFDDGPSGYLNRIMAHQVSNPTAPQSLVIEEISTLQGNHLRKIISSIIGPMSPQALEAAKTNIIALCVFPRLAPAMRQHLFPEVPDEKQLTEFVQHQYQFALAGLQSLKVADRS